MYERVAAAHARLDAAVDDLTALLGTATDDEICALQIALEATARRLDHAAVAALAAARQRGIYTERGYRSPATALADLLRWEPRRARRFTTAAEAVTTRTGLDGTPLPARLPATATVFASGEVSLRHVEVISALLGSAPATRLDTGTLAGAEEALAGQALLSTPAELHTWGTQLLEALDQDGPEPDDAPPPETNQLRITRHRNRPGGTLRARYDDAAMFDRIAAALDAMSAPSDPDDARDHAERAAEALAELCGFALTHAPGRMLPETGGRRPQVVVTIPLADLEHHAGAATLEYGGQLSPAALRMLACDAAALPVVLAGNGRPLDVGRTKRTVTDAQRRALTARDRGCAHPGCDRPPAWCEAHHIVPWEQGGPTDLDNLVLLCRVHHRLVHHSRWEIRTTSGRPEFIPPGWIDPQRRPRRTPDAHPVVPPPRTPDQHERPPPDTRVEIGAPEVRTITFDELTAGITGGGTTVRPAPR
ncbi:MULTISPECIES: HNH endonuclease signature motif containing protein [Pseudonocardia]|uniref:HNH endonuclease n=2 Tax=Pseudonocardia TaxID=1847 RepID=A0A1Y2N5J4_PSEAH|nr:MULTISPECIES: HNH endonuclease signature motif containing protein [Pseudonocardia]OSY42735.1 HNH endonuclease [Pseudonocardia autotrophica]TDN77312.1 5-methylcytosine-specific restriction protein A [Pseudonocardia autotrophica]BBG01334.1 HNH endonuclease [Pseudonocardia autotrophica]GEC24390.1 HNH endonuclease [Pseudonocardia saturnea]